jgi:hypothetical protein
MLPQQGTDAIARMLWPDAVVLEDHEVDAIVYSSLSKNRI